MAKNGERFVQRIPDGQVTPTVVISPIEESEYTCPGTEWVNCMPIVLPERQWRCTVEYLSWAQENCPNFKGAAY